MGVVVRAGGLVLILAWSHVHGAGASPTEVQVQNQGSDADAEFQKVVEALQQVGEKHGGAEHCDLLYQAAELSDQRSQFAQGLNYAQQGLDMARVLKDPMREGLHLRMLGRHQRNLGRYPEAMASLDASSLRFEALGLKVERALAMEERALVYRRLGELTRALEDLQFAWEVLEAHGRPEQKTRALNNLGLVQMKLALWDEAMATFTRGLELAERENIRSSMATLRENMADHHIQRGKYREARPLLDRALEIQKVDRRWRNYSTTLYTLGQLFMRTGHFEDADRVLRESLSIKEAIQDHYGLVTTLIHLGMNQGRGGHLHEAVQTLERASRLAAEAGAAVQESDAQRELAQVHKARGSEVAALKALERHLELQAVVQSEENRRRLSLVQYRMELHRREQEIGQLRRTQAERERDLRRAHVLRNVILGASGLVLALALALYARYRQVRRLYQALAESEIRFRALAEQSPVGAWILQDGVVQYVNQALAGFFGKRAEDVRGQNPDTFIQSHTDPSDQVPGLAEALDGEGKALHLEYYAEELDLQGRQATLEVYIDVTPRREVEAELGRYRESLQELVEERTRELHEAHRELLRRERLSTLGRLTATVAHELRNPLGAIRTSLFSLGRWVEAGEGTVERKALALAERSILRCEGLVQELLAFSSSRPLQKEPTDLAAWLRDLLYEFACQEGPRAVLDLGEVPTLKFDREQLRRALLNILENACHALKAAGSDRPLEIRLRPMDGWVVLAVEDTGVGISEEILPKVFEPLFSTKSFGSGLGLPVVKDVLERHGGHVRLESQEGKGTVVELWLPMA